LVGNKTGLTRLGFALLLKFFELEARFPRSAGELPPAALAYVAEQVKVGAGELAAYRWDGRTIEYHRAQVRAAFGFREFTRGDGDKLADWLASDVCPVELRDEQLREALLVRCRAERIEPPGRVERIVGSARATFERQFCDRIVSRLDERCSARLEALLTGEGATGRGGGFEGRSGHGGLGDAATGDRQVDRCPGVAATGGVVRGFVGAADRGVAGPGGPVGPAGGWEQVRLALLAALCWVRSSDDRALTDTPDCTVTRETKSPARAGGASTLRGPRSTDAASVRTRTSSRNGAPLATKVQGLRLSAIRSASALNSTVMPVRPTLP
jgi:hypothetical protein